MLEIGDEGQGEGLGCRGGAVLEGHDQADAVGVGVAPGVEVAGAPQGLAEVGVVAALGHLVHEDDGQLVLALHRAQERQQARGLTGAVLVEAVESDERTVEEQAGTEHRYQLAEALLVFDEVEAQGGGGDDVEVELVEGEAAVGGDAGDALADDGQGALGEIDERRAGLVDGEASERGRVGGESSVADSGRSTAAAGAAGTSARRPRSSAGITRACRRRGAPSRSGARPGTPPGSRRTGRGTVGRRGRAPTRSVPGSRRSGR